MDIGLETIVATFAAVTGTITGIYYWRRLALELKRSKDMKLFYHDQLKLEKQRTQDAREYYEKRVAIESEKLLVELKKLDVEKEKLLVRQNNR